MSDHRQVFSGLAGAYSQGRPDYPPQAAAYVFGLLAPGTTAPQVADIGAGTGKFSAALAAYARSGARPDLEQTRIWAVEPNADMRRQSEADLAAYDDVCSVAGSAEDSTLPAGSIDLVVCAQAFHWFDPVAFRRECDRIGRDRAPVAIVYNTVLGRNRHDELSWWDPPHPSPTWADRRADIRRFFGGYLLVAEFPHPVRYARADYLAYMLSHSSTPRPADSSYRRYLDSVQAIFDRDEVDGLLTLELTTMVYTSSRPSL